MKKIEFLLFFAILFPFTVRAQRQITMERMWKHMYTLSDDSLQGRHTGTVYADKAAKYICQQLQEMGAKPYSDTSYYFPIFYGSFEGKNVMALIPGSDSLLKNEYIIIGAHYDHIGTRSGNGDTIFNGADDNASGVTVLLEVTRALIAHPEKLKRSVLIAFFDAEEVGLYGSMYLAEHCVFPLEKLKLMMSIDMVGYLQTSGFLKYEGAGTLKNGAEIIGSLPWEAPYGKVEIKKFESSIFTATDTRRFAELACPTLSVSTGLKSPYHKVNDEASGIDFMGMTYIADHLTALVTRAAADEQFESSGRVADIHAPYKPHLFGFSLMFCCGNSHLDLQESELVGRRKNAFGLDAELHYMPFEKFEMGLGLGYHCFGSGYTQLHSYTAHSFISQFRLQYNTINTKLENKGVKMSIFVAPYFYYIFDATMHNLLTKGQEMSWNKLIHSQQYGISFGAHYTFGHFLIEYRYYNDLSPMLKDTYYPEGYNRSNTFSIGYMF